MYIYIYVYVYVYIYMRSTRLRSRAILQIECCFRSPQESFIFVC